MLNFIRNLRDIYREYQNEQIRDHQREETLYTLIHLGYWGDRVGDLGDPTVDIGASFRLAKRLGIELHPGLSYGDIRAVLPEEKWRGTPNVSYLPLGDWVARKTVQEAICDCILSCHNIGILSMVINHA